jgi:predicted rRNA pseudouridine synthase
MADSSEKIPPQPLWHGAGIIIIDKPRGPSSHQVAAWVGKMLGCQVGHAGTLDPQVSGVLLVMLGNAVRLAPLLLKHDKEYVCLMRLHEDVEKSRIGQVAREFTGRIYQRPPKKSAVKRNLRIRTIHRLDLLSIENRLVLFRVQCDAGTYIRSLCHHMGLALGTGAHMQELRRTRSGAFGEESARTLHALQDACVAAREGDRSLLDAMIVSVDAAVPDLPVVVVRDTAIDALCRGAALAGVGVIRCDEFKKDQPVAVLSIKNEFIGLGRGLVSSSSFSPGDTGLVIAMTSVFLPAGTYPRGWRKRERPEKPKPSTRRKDSIKKIPG